MRSFTEDSLETRIAADLGVMQEWVASAIANAPNNYKSIKIPKRSGGMRTILQPAIESKMIQRWFMSKLLSLLPVSDIATAFEPGSSIVHNASAHKNSRYSVRIDVANFFPSLTASDLERAIHANLGTLPRWASAKHTIDVLRAVCFLPDGSLPIGFPSSPSIANAVMYELDRALMTLTNATPAKYGQAVLTRYADDFVFSTNLAGACSLFVSETRRVFGECLTPKLSLNLRKTRMMSRAAGSTLITGLRVRPDGEIGVHANYRDVVRLLLKLYASDELDAGDIPTLRGHLAFIKHADPGLFTRLSFRYHRQMESLLKSKTGAGTTRLKKAA